METANASQPAVADPTDVANLESTRTRLARLIHALDLLRGDLMTSDPLPSWAQLQSSLTNVTDQLQHTSAHLTENGSALSSMLTYPLPSFPGVEMFGIVETLFKKKLGADMDEWAAENTKTANELTPTTGLSREAYQDLWTFADKHNDQIAEEVDFELDYTLEEIQEGQGSVNTGIRRTLKTSSSDDDSELGDRPDHDRQAQSSSRTAPMALETILRFLDTGNLGK